MKLPEWMDDPKYSSYNGYICAGVLTFIGSHLFTMIDLEERDPVTNVIIGFFATCVLVGAHNYAITALEYQIGARK